MDFYSISICFFFIIIILFLLKCLILNHHQYCFVNSSSLIFRYFIHIQTRNLIGINRNTLEYLWPRPLDVCALKLCTHIIISTTPLALPFLLTLSLRPLATAYAKQCDECVAWLGVARRCCCSSYCVSQRYACNPYESALNLTNPTRTRRARQMI